MFFYCNFCDIEVETDLKKHRGCARLVQTRTITNAKNSDISTKFFDHVIIHNKKFESYTIEVTFKIELDNNSYPTFKTIVFHLPNTPTFNLQSHIKQYPNFYHISETITKTIADLIIKTISDKRLIKTFKHYLNNAMEMVERRLNMIIPKNPHLNNSLNRTFCHPLIKTYSHVPFNI